MTKEVFRVYDVTFECIGCCKGWHGEGDELGISDALVDTFMDTGIGTGIIPSVVFGKIELYQIALSNRIEDSLSTVDDKTVALCLGRDRAMINTIEIFTEHREGKRGKLLVEMLFIHGAIVA